MALGTDCRLRLSVTQSATAVSADSVGSALFPVDLSITGEIPRRCAESTEYRCGVSQRSSCGSRRVASWSERGMALAIVR